MLTQDTSEKLKSIYDAAFSGDRWQPALDAIKSVTSAKDALLYSVNAGGEVVYALNACSSSLIERFPGTNIVKEYQQMQARGETTGFDEEGATALHSAPPLVARSDDLIWTVDDGYSSRPEVRFCIERLGTYRRFCINLSHDPLNLTGLSFLYAPRFNNALADQDMRAAEQFAPHMAKAVEMNRVMNGLRTKYNAVLSVLDRIDIAICILDDRGQVILANRQGQALLDSQDGLAKGRDGRLKLAADDDTARALDAIRRVAQTARGENDDTSEVIEVTRRSTSTALYGMVSPLRDADMELEAGLHGALLTVIDPAKPVRTRVEAAAKAYGLTPAEERVAVLLAGGRANAEIAEILSVSPETVKSQISSIFGKMQCRTRAAYIWRIFQFSPPIL